MINVIGTQVNKVSMVHLALEGYIERGFSVFYVRPFTDDLADDLARLVEDAKRPAFAGKVEITEKNGVYRVAASEAITSETFVYSLWGMLFRRFSSAAKEVRADELTQKRFYKAVFSNQFISACERVYVA